MSKKPGRFIVFEGCEGAGKTLQIKLLREKFSESDKIIFTREPGGTPVSEDIRAIILNNSYLKPPTLLVEIMLFCTARAQHVQEKILPALRKGFNVICDRFSFSTLAYQYYGNERPDLIKEIIQLDEIATGELKVDEVIYLDVTPEIGLTRKRSAGEGEINSYDERELAFHQRVREGFLTQIKMTKENPADKPNWHMIETGSKSIEEVHLGVLKILRDIFPR